MATVLLFDFPGLWRPFGHSIYRDEYRANFAQVEREISLELTSVGEADRERRAGLDLLTAIHGILTGEISKAESILNRLLSPESGLGPIWQLRAENYRQLIIQNSSVLHAFDNSLDLPGFQSVVFKALKAGSLEHAVHLEEFKTQMTKIENDWTLLDSLAITARTVASKIPENSPIHPRLPQTLQQNQQMAKGLDSLLANYGVGYTQKLRAEIAHVQGLSSDALLLNEARGAYERVGDLVGQAACVLLQGDWTVSQPFGSPTSLNLIVCESTSFNGASQWDSLENELQLRDSRTAYQHYDTAQRLFDQAGAVRGVAAVHLRKACLTNMNLIFYPNTDSTVDEDIAQWRNQLDTAGRLFRDAGDHPSVRLVSTHQIILNILVKRSLFRASEASAIGNWGATSGSFQYAHDLGLLLLRTGNFVWRRWQSFDKSLLFFEAAQELFSTLGAQGSESQAEAARAEVLAKKLDLVAARVLFLSAESRLQALWDLLSNIQSRVNWRVPLKSIKLSLNGAMVEPFYYLGELSTIDRLLQQVRDTSDNDGELASRVAQAILYKHKLQYRDNMRKNKTSQALESLEEGFQELSRLSTGEHGDAAQIACINLLSEVMRFEEAQGILRSRHHALESASGSSVGPITLWNSRFRAQMQLKPIELMFSLALFARDFETAMVYSERLPNQPTPSSTDLLERSPSALLNASLLHEGRGMIEDAMTLVNAAVHAIEKSQAGISDQDIRMTSFGHSEAAEVFDCAVRISFRFLNNSDTVKPQEMHCVPKLDGLTWKDQALIFAESGKAKSLLESIRTQKGVESKAREAMSKIVQQSSHVRKIMEEIAKSTKEIDRLQRQIAQEPREPSFKDQSNLQKELSTKEDDKRKLENSLPHEQSELKRIKLSLNDQFPYLSDVYIQQSTVRTDLTATFDSIPPDSAVVEFCTMADGIGVFVIRKGGILAATWVDIKYLKVQMLVADFLHFMKAKNRKGSPDWKAVVQQRIKDLSKLLIRPVEDHLQGIENLIFVPSDCLFNFPFGVLESGGEPLVVKHSIMQIPSLTIWSEVHSRQSKNLSNGRERQVFGSSNRVKDLRYGRIEALILSKDLSAKLNLADQMDDENFRAATEYCSLLHICTHGHFDHDAPLLSKITALPRGLDVIGLAKLLHPIRLVVFSACFSGFGKVLGSNDAYGFPHAILSSGASAFVGSLWAADDQASLLLMVFFYQEMTSSATGATIAQSLRAAQMRLRRLTSEELQDCVDRLTETLKQCDKAKVNEVIGLYSGLHWLKELRMLKVEDLDDPYYWAPFILTGDGFQVL